MPELPQLPSLRAPTEIFRPWHTALFRLAIGLTTLGLTGLGYAAFNYYHSSYWTRVGVPPRQPVLFSHRHHAGELRIDCRHCHATVETSAFAGMPSTQACLTCHSQIFTDTSMLRPVVLSAERGEPLHWQRVTRLPDHVFFNHSIHVAKGVGCTSCHGDVGDMAILGKGEPLTMRWCIECHRDPGPRLRSADAVFAAHAPAKDAPSTQPTELLRYYEIHPRHLTNCSTCHH